MWKVTPGMILIVWRHSLSLWNLVRNQAKALGLETPKRTPEMQDPDLAPFGRLGSGLLGINFRQCLDQLGVTACDVVARSRFRRSAQTVDWAFSTARMSDPRMTVVLPELDEQSHSLALPTAFVEYLAECKRIAETEDDPMVRRVFEKAMSLLLGSAAAPYPMPQGHRPSPAFGSHIGAQVNYFQDLRNAQEEVARLGLTGRDKERHIKGALNEALRRWQKTVGTQVVANQSTDEVMDLLTRRKTPFGESFIDMRDHVEAIRRHVQEWVWDRNKRVVGLCTHSRKVIAIRQSIEGFSDAEAAMILKSEGPPFPPNGCMTIYKEQNGRLVLWGEPQRLPPQLKSVGRDLRLVDPTDPLVVRVMSATGVKMKRARSQGSKGFVWTQSFDNVDTNGFSSFGRGVRSNVPDDTPPSPIVR